MQKKVITEKYNFIISLEDNLDTCLFSILAICNQTGRYSSINNLNQIIADLNIDPANPKYEDSNWVLSVREGRKLFNRAVNLFNGDYLAFLKDRLDEDRSCGEWENTIHSEFANTKDQNDRQ